MGIIIFVILLLLTCLLVAIVVSADIAITASSKLKLYRISKEGDHRAKILLDLQNNIGSVSASLHFLDTMISTLSATLATGLIAVILPDINASVHALIITVLFAFFITTYGQIAPVIYVYSNPERIALLYAKVLWKWYRLTRFITSLIERIARYTMKIVGMKIHEKTHVIDSDELKMAIDLHDGDSSYTKTILRSIVDVTNIKGIRNTCT